MEYSTKSREPSRGGDERALYLQLVCCLTTKDNAFCALMSIESSPPLHVSESRTSLMSGHSPNPCHMRGDVKAMDGYDSGD
jgi:hypothetical protein